MPSAPTLIALFPVFASFFFGSHTEHWTDLILLGLVAIYLHNCVSGEFRTDLFTGFGKTDDAVPWSYYKVSRKRYKTSNLDRMTTKQQEVSKQLMYAEIQAFGGLIVGPLLGAVLLNYVRASMARPANGLITNFNITVFVLAAELRPLKVAVKFLTDRSSSLQEELVDVAPGRYDELATKLSKVEQELSEIMATNTSSPRSNSSEHGVVDGTLDLDQIKNALRRFERHEAQIKQHYDDKLYTLERRLADLANRPQVVSGGGSGAVYLESALLFPVRLGWSLVTLPFKSLGYVGRSIVQKRSA